MRTVSPYQYGDGFYLTATTCLNIAAAANERGIAYYVDDFNQILFRYDQDSELLTLHLLINGDWIVADVTDVSLAEWNGTDGLCHDLTIIVDGDNIQTFRDGDPIFNATDPRIAQFPRTGCVLLRTAFSAVCFDNVALVNLGNVQNPSCGDCDNSGGADIDDVVYLVTYIFQSGPEPFPLEAGEVNCSGAIDIDDVVYLISYIFGNGAAPCAACP